MTTGVLIVLLALGWLLALRLGRPIAMSIVGFIIGVLLAAANSSVASITTTLVDGVRAIVVAIGKMLTSQ